MGTPTRGEGKPQSLRSSELWVRKDSRQKPESQEKWDSRRSGSRPHARGCGSGPCRGVQGHAHDRTRWCFVPFHR